jgi:hypothetical protein
MHVESPIGRRTFLQGAAALTAASAASSMASRVTALSVAYTAGVTITTRLVPLRCCSSRYSATLASLCMREPGRDGGKRAAS